MTPVSPEQAAVPPDDSPLLARDGRPVSVVHLPGELAPYARLVPDARHLYSGPWLPGVPRGATSIREFSRR